MMMDASRILVVLGTGLFLIGGLHYAFRDTDDAKVAMLAAIWCEGVAIYCEIAGV